MKSIDAHFSNQNLKWSCYTGSLSDGGDAMGYTLEILVMRLAQTNCMTETQLRRTLQITMVARKKKDYSANSVAY